MKINIKNMHKLIIFSLVIAALLPACTKSNSEASTVNEFLSSDVELQLTTDHGYLKVFDGAGNYQYFNNVLPDTLGFAVDTINKFLTIDGRVVDTIWFTKDYLEAPDTTSEGHRHLYIPVEKYNRGKMGPTAAFNFQAATVRSDAGSLDISGAYQRGTATINIIKVGAGTYVIDNAVSGAISPQPNVVFVKSDNTLEIPDNSVGFALGSTGISALVTCSYYNASYSLMNTTPGTGDTLRYTIKREARAAAKQTLIRL